MGVECGGSGLDTNSSLPMPGKTLKGRGLCLSELPGIGGKE